MTLDSRLQVAADETRERLSGFTPPPIRSSLRRLVPIAGMAIAAALVVVVVVWTGITSLSRPADDGVYLGPGEVLLSEDKPVVVQGAPSVEPRFDVAELGEEAPLGPVTDVTELVAQVQLDSEGEVFRITVIGVTGDGATAALVYADGVGLDLRPLRLDCLWIDGPLTCGGTPIDEIVDQPGGLPDLQTESELVAMIYTIPGPSLLVAGPAPEGTSVVVFTSNGTSIWQRPVGGIAVFDIDLREGDVFDLREGDVFVLTALDANGDTILRRETTAGE